MTIYHTIQDCYYFRIHMNGIVGRGESNLVPNDVEVIDLL